MPRVELRDYRKARTPFGSLLRLFRYFRHCRTIMICAVASILVYVAATIAASYCMKPLVNLLKQTGLAPSEVYAKYLALLLGLAGLYALSAVTNYLLNRLMLECSTVIMRALRTELFAKMQRLPISYFDANTNGSLMSYFTNDIEATNELLQHAITQMLISVTSLLGTIGMMLALSLRLFFLMVVLADAVAVTSAAAFRFAELDRIKGFLGFRHFETHHLKHLGEIRERKDREAFINLRKANAAVDEGAGSLTKDIEVARHMEHLFNGRTNGPEGAGFINKEIVNLKRTKISGRNAHRHIARRGVNGLRELRTLCGGEGKRMSLVKESLRGSSLRGKKLGKRRHGNTVLEYQSSPAVG